MNVYHFIDKKNKTMSGQHIFANSREEALKVITNSFQYKEGMIKDGEFDVEKTGENYFCEVCR